MIKKAVLLLIFVLSFASVVSFANDNIEGWDIPVDIKVNNLFINSDVQAFIFNGSTYAPVRFVAEALGVYEIVWNEKEQSVILRNNENSIKLEVGEQYAYVNNIKTKLANSVILTGGRTFVPVRFIAESLGANVSWDNKYYIANIGKDGVTVSGNLVKGTYSEYDLLWLGRIIQAESGGEPLIGKIGVGDVILNRVKNQEFPNSIYEVIFDSKYGVQFQPVINNTIYNEPTDASVVAAKYALNGRNVVGDSLYFLNPRTSTSFWIINNRSFYTSLYNHDFYL